MFDPCSMCAYPRVLVSVNDFYRPGPLLFFRGATKSYRVKCERSLISLELTTSERIPFYLTIRRLRPQLVLV